MSTFSDNMASIATSLIAEFGQSASFTRTTQGTYDPEALEATGETSTTFTGSIVPSAYSTREIDGVNIQVGDSKVLAHIMDEVPMVGDVLTFGSQDFRVINVAITKANGNDCLYTLQVRE